MQKSKFSLLAGTLFVSVVLNLFLVGVLAGVLPGHRHHSSFAPMALATRHGEYLVDGMVRYLDPADATAFRDAAQAQAAALKQAHDNVRQATKAAAVVFEQDPPDPAALQSALDHLSQTKADVDAIVKKIVQDAYTRLSPEGRHRLAELTR